MSRSHASSEKKQNPLVLPENTERGSCDSNELLEIIKLNAQALALAPSVQADCLTDQIAKILAVMAPYMRWRDKGRHVLVTDRTIFGDFHGLTDKVAAEIGAKLGFKITPGDYLVEVATQMVHADNPR